jgi:hypothetical protein
MPTSDPAGPFTKAARLAGAVLAAAVDQDWGRARRALERLNTECSPGGLGVALMVWCDALGEHANGGPFEFGRVRIMDLDQDTGARLTQTTPRQRWTNQLITARVAGDKAAFGALIDELNTLDAATRGAYAASLIEAVAGTIRLFPPGYARQGLSPPAS